MAPVASWWVSVGQYDVIWNREGDQVSCDYVTGLESWYGSKDSEQPLQMLQVVSPKGRNHLSGEKLPWLICSVYQTGQAAELNGGVGGLTIPTSLQLIYKFSKIPVKIPSG